MTTKTRLLAALLAFCCIFGSVPALAAETTELTQDASVISENYLVEAEDVTDDSLSPAEEDTATAAEGVYIDEELPTEAAEESALEEEQVLPQSEDAQMIAPEDEDPLAFGHVGAQTDAQEELYDSNGVSQKFVNGTIGKTTTYSFLTNKTYSVPVGYNILHGIDVSRYNAGINWTAVKKAGVDFAIIRIGYSGYMTGALCEDSYYKTNLKNATAAGIPVGVYIFSQALTTAEARAEANFVLSRIKNYNITLPVVMDYEFAGDPESRLYVAKLSKAQATSNCLAFIDTVKKAGYEPMVYANKSYLTNNLNASTVAAAAPIWLANYTTNTTYSGEYDYWQYSEDGYLNACSGNGGRVDANFLFTKKSNSNTDKPSIDDEPANNTSGFKDVSSSAWYASAVDYVVDHNVMVGTSSTTFEPDTTVTRAMAAQILYNLAGKPSVSGSCSFKDVSAGSWYAKAVTWAQTKGIMSGYSTSQFGPNDIITREQLATVLYRYADYANKSVSASASLSKFPDAGSVSSFASKAMKWAVANNVINGAVSDGNTLLLPKGKASRAECAKIMMNYLSGVGK